MSPQDTLLTLLDTERAHFLSQVERIPVERRGMRPAPDSWSVAEIIEHVSRVDIGVTKLLSVRSAEPLTATDGELREAELTPEKIARVRNHADPFQAPERVRPTGKLTPEAALEQLNEARNAVRSAYLAADPTVLDGALYPHPMIGPLTLRGWFLMAAHHDARHAQQIAAIADADVA